MTQKRRLEQINSLLQEEIGSILLLEAPDPIFTALTVTEVRVTADLSQAKVFVMVSRPVEGAEPIRISEADLQLVADKVRRLLAPKLSLKRTPRLHFIIDETEERAEYIENLLRQVKSDWDDTERNTEC
jgi:ribosome-binding factor A